MKPGNLSDPTAESDLETNAPSSPGTAASPYKPSPYGTRQNRALPICHLPRKSSAPCISSAINSALEITFFFLFRAFFSSYQQESVPLLTPGSSWWPLSVASNALRCRVEMLSPGWWGRGGAGQPSP